MIAIESTQVDQGKSLLVIGDLLIDETHHVTVSKLSPEAPVPVAALTHASSKTPGGAGLGASFAALGGTPTYFATYCDPDTNRWLLENFKIKRILSPQISTVTNITKTRYIDTASGYHLIRVDNDDIADRPFSDEIIAICWEQSVIDIIKPQEIGAVLILDYRKGLLSNHDRVQRIIRYTQAQSIPIYVDSRSSKLNTFKHADILKLNTKEFNSACSLLDIDSIPSLSQRLDIPNIIITDGAAGATLYQSHDNSLIIYSPNISIYTGSPDVTGCGDVFDVTFCVQWGINKVNTSDALHLAVNRATKFAYENVRTRLLCH